MVSEINKDYYLSTNLCPFSLKEHPMSPSKKKLRAGLRHKYTVVYDMPCIIFTTISPHVQVQVIWKWQTLGLENKKRTFSI